MNKLKIIKNMGFEITWKLIFIGLFGMDQIPIQLTDNEMFDYLNDELCVINEKTDNIIQVICEEGDIEKVHALVSELADKEHSEMAFQARKWRAYMLKDALDNLNSDCLQAILQLMDFWVSMGIPKDCPQEFPQKNEKGSEKNYFTQSMLEILIAQNTKWLLNEIDNIISLEQSRR